VVPSYRFKSDRCGIETMQLQHHVQRFESSNQTVAGLKLVVIACARTASWCSNQTVAGLKPASFHRRHRLAGSSNQTVAGLKFYMSQQRHKTHQ